MIKSLTDARLTDGLPRIIADQDWVIALSEAWSGLHQKTLTYADNSQIYTEIDTVPERILDILAVNWKIDWYDTGLSEEQKRRIVKTYFETRRVMGTARAVKLQANAFYPGTTIKEWFDIGSEPGTFDIELTVLPTDADIWQFIYAIWYTKNVRSHLRQMLVKLRGSLDDGDLMDGRTKKNPFGVETHYLLTYYGHFSHEGLEQINTSRVRFGMAAPFWDYYVLNGDWLLDGSVQLHQRRRYNLLLREHYRYGISFWKKLFWDGGFLLDGAYLLDGKIQFPQKVSVRFQTKQHTQEVFSYRGETERVRVNFWQPYSLDASWLLDGRVLLDKQRRYGIRLSQRHRYGVSFWRRLYLDGNFPLDGSEVLSGNIQKELGVTIRTKSSNFWRLDGARTLDGTRTLDSHYRKEIVE